MLQSLHTDLKVPKLENKLQYPASSKAIPLQALRGPEGSRRLRLPGFKTIGT
jgi:hypothetical protein